MGKARGFVVLGLMIAAGCTVSDPSPSLNPDPQGGSSGAATGGSFTGGSGASAGTSAVAGSSLGGSGGAAPQPEAGSGGEEPVIMGGAAGAAGEGGTGGEAGSGDPDGCAPACSETQTCVGGTCRDQDCQPAASFCSGTALRTCADDGLSSTTSDTCSAGKYCDPDKASCETASYGTCPRLYLGSGRFGSAPRPVSEANDAILMNSYEVKLGTQVFGQVRVHNLGTDNSPSSHVELFLSESPGFPTAQNRLIFELNGVVPGAAVGGNPGELAQNWSYTFTTLGRHVLLARVENNSPPTGASCAFQGYDTSHPTTDPLTAVHYVHVVE